MWEKKRKEKHFETYMMCINFDFCPNKNMVKHDASGTKGILSCCKCLFEYICIVANWAHIQAEKKVNVPNVKCVFW